MGALKHGPRDQRGPPPAVLALKGLTSPLAQDIMIRLTTVEAAKPVWPAGAFQRRFTPRLDAELLQKRRQRQAGLKWDAIYRHARTPR